MSTNTINLTDEATKAINALQHPCGTYEYYYAALTRIFTYVLHCSDEIGMSETETVSTLRAIDGIRSDLSAIAGPVAQQHVSDPKDLMSTIEEIFPGEEVEVNENENEKEHDEAGITAIDE